MKVHGSMREGGLVSRLFLNKSTLRCVTMTDGTIEASLQSYLIAPQLLVTSVSGFASPGAMPSGSGGESQKFAFKTDSAFSELFFI